MSGNGIWDEAIRGVTNTFGPSLEEETKEFRYDIWEDVTRRYDERFGRPKRPAYKDAEAPTKQPADAANDLESYIQERGKHYAQEGTTDKDIVDKTLPQYIGDEVSEENKEIASEFVTKSIKSRFGDRWDELSNLEKERLIEYETQRKLDEQFGTETDYSTWGTLKHGFFEGIDEYSMMSNADKWFAVKFPSLGGKFLAVNPRTGRREFFVGYNEVIPDFEEMSEDDRREAIKTLHKQERDRYAAEVTADQEGFAHGAAGFAGALTDPSTLIPVSKFGSGYKAMAYAGGTIGATDAFLWDMANEGHINPLHITVGAVGGAALSVAAGAAFNKFHSVWNRKSMNSTLNKYEKVYNEMVAKGAPHDLAEAGARWSTGRPTDAALNDMYNMTGRVRRGFADGGPQLPKNAAEARNLLDEKTSFLARFKLFDKPRAMLNKVGKTFDYYARPVDDYMRDHAPRIFQELGRMEQKVHERTHQWASETETFFKLYDKLDPATQKLLDGHLLHNSADRWGQAYKIMHDLGVKDKNLQGLAESFDSVRTALREINVLYNQAGYKLPMLNHYFPRVALDGNISKKITHSFFQKKMAEAIKKNGGKPLSESQTNKLINDIVNYKPKGSGKVATSGSLKNRAIEEINEALIPHYAKLPAAFHSYARMAALDIERANFFKAFGKTKFSIYGDDLTPKKIQGAMADELRRLGHLYKGDKGVEEITPQGLEIIEGLQSRFAMGEMSPSAFIRGFKNLGYTTTIANPLGAATQLGDNAFSLTKFGLRDTLKAIFKVHAPAHGADSGILEKEALGLTNALEEIYSNPALFKKTLDRAMNWGQFNRLDKFGKDTILRSAVNNAQRKLKTDAGKAEFLSKWGIYFEKETFGLMEDILKFNKSYQRQVFTGKKAGQAFEDVGRLTDNMKLWLWHELADVQPISLSQMPRGYLDHPNGRVFYMLKTFTIKQIDFMRRSILREYAKGNYAQGTANLVKFVTFWSAANLAADKVKSTLTLEEEFKPTDHMIENVLQLVLYSKYTGDSIVDDGVIGSMALFLAPPVPYIDRPIRALVDVYKDKNPMVNATYPIPVAGPLISKTLRNREEADKNKYKMPEDYTSPILELQRERKNIMKELYKGSLD